MKHCENIHADRKLGQYWERQFCLMAADAGFMFTPMQIGRDGAATAFSRAGPGWKRLTLPDITIWTAPGQHHEIKHKNPTRRGMFGLEKYRFDALLAFADETGQPVCYTIHNHDLSGGRDAWHNAIGHWLTVDVLYLDGRWSSMANFSSWVNGRKKSVLQYFWPIKLWKPLANYWGAMEED